MKSLKFQVLSLKGVGLLLGMILLGGHTVLSEGPTPRVVYVATTGSDTNPGTESLPVATVAKAITLIDQEQKPGEVILRGGTYQASRVNIRAVSNPALRPLLIRAADGEEVIFDGSVRITEAATPVEGVPGVWKLTGSFSTRVPPAIWAEPEGKLFTRMADLNAVRQVEYSCTLLDTSTVAFHTPGGVHPRGLQLFINRDRTAFEIYRDDVTFRGIRFQNYTGSESHSSLYIYGKNFKMDSCVVNYCSKGVLIVTGAADTQIVGCSFNDSNSGVYNRGVNSLIEGNRIINRRFGLLSLEAEVFLQDTGVATYFNNGGATIRNNFIEGFTNGLFHKNGAIGPYVVENNTFIRTRQNLFSGSVGSWNHTWFAGTVYWQNIFVGFNRFITLDPLNPEQANVVDRNLVYAPDNAKGVSDDLKLFEQAWGGRNNVMADPMFVDASRGDYRVYPQSSAVSLSTATDPILDPVGSEPALPAGTVLRPFLEVIPQTPAQLETMRDTSLPAGQCWITAGTSMGVSMRVVSGQGAPAGTWIRFNAGPAQRKGFSELEPIALPSDGLHQIGLKVEDAGGRMSEERILYVTRSVASPQVQGELLMRTNRNGGVLLFETDRICTAKLEIQINLSWVLSSEHTSTRHRERFSMAAMNTTGAAQIPYRLTLTDSLKKTRVMTGTFIFSGEPRGWHVALTGIDADDRGSRGEPFRTLGFALKQVLPGDTVILAPGLYFGEAGLNHGGTSEAPITIKAERRDTVFLDGGRVAGTLLSLVNAPWIRIENLQFRWFVAQGISLSNSPHVTVKRCQFHNRELSTEWPTGSGIYAMRSPFLKVTRSLFIKMNIPLYLYECSNTRITGNTFYAAAAGGLDLRRLSRVDSWEGTVVKDNVFAYTGNYCVGLDGPDPAQLNSLTLERNNYAITVLADREERPDDDLPLVYPGAERSKGFIYFQTFDANNQRIAQRIYSRLEIWQELSGKDGSSMMAHPLFVDPGSLRFDVLPESPHLLPDGSVIGALGDLTRGPWVKITSPQAGDPVSDPLRVRAVASDYDDRVCRVVFSVDGIRVREVRDEPYEIEIPSLSGGSHVLKVEAVDDQGVVSASHEVRILGSGSGGLMYGDVSDNRGITAEDAWLVARYSVGLIPDAQIPGLCNGLTAEEFRRRGDVDGVTGLSANDAMLIAKRAVGLIEKFPVEG